MMKNVILVGAGCGKDLITVKGLQAVRTAEAIVYDDLLDADVLAQAPDGCECIYVGKRSGRHGKPQAEINDLLVQLARAGKRVVRLKGGDSFVFGRGGEEMLYLAQHGVGCEVIAGVSSAVAVPEHFGIPVTHRGTAQSFCVVTGHTAAQTEEDYRALAALKGTLVFLMGHDSAGEIAQKLIAAGKDENTKVSVLSKGFSAEEQRVDGTLKELGALAAQTATPAILVIGEVAGFRLGTKPQGALSGLRVTVTGSEDFAAKLQSALGKAGAETDVRSVIRIVPLDAAIPRDLAGYTWLCFTSSNGVRLFFEGLRRRKGDVRALADKKFACIGAGTAQTLSDYGIFADLVPARYTAEDLGAALAQRLIKNDRLLILRAKDGSAALRTPLDAAQIPYTDAIIYETQSAITEPAAVKSDYIVFASASGAHSFFGSGASLAEQTKIVCIGEATRQAVLQHTEKPCLIAQRHDVSGIVQTIADDAGRTVCEE